jgi:hypothetical protein
MGIITSLTIVTIIMITTRVIAIATLFLYILS